MFYNLFSTIVFKCDDLPDRIIPRPRLFTQLTGSFYPHDRAVVSCRRSRATCSTFSWDRWCLDAHLISGSVHVKCALLVVAMGFYLQKKRMYEFKKKTCRYIGRLFVSVLICLNRMGIFCCVAHLLIFRDTGSLEVVRYET